MSADTSSKCSLSSTNTTITQLMKMTMETSEEVSTRQDIKRTSIIIMLKGREDMEGGVGGLLKGLCSYLNVQGHSGSNMTKSLDDEVMTKGLE